MANTNTLQRSINYATILARGAPLSTVLQYANEPALTIGDYVRQFILGPPFAWRWNRGITAFNAVTGVSDYALTQWTPSTPVSVGWIIIDTNGDQQQVTTAGTTGMVQPAWSMTSGTPTTDNNVTWTNGNVVGTGTFQSIANFGWLEKGVAIESDTQISHELGVLLNLGLETVQNQPFKISPILDNSSGVYTFRMISPPEKAYLVTLTYQLAAPSFSSLSGLWSPIPDYMSYVYNQGMVAKMYEYLNYEGYLPEQQLFLRQVIAVNAGLTESQVNIFLGDKIITAREGQEALGNSQSGRQSRGAF
jgi:hypothetical protein